MKKFFLIQNKKKDKDGVITKEIAQYIQSKGGVCYVYSEPIEQWKVRISIPTDAECIVVLGGDGTVLRAARATLHSKLPIVGVNLGNLGFLTEIEPEQYKNKFQKLFEDKYTIENRMLLEGTVYRNGDEIYRSVACNDIAVSRSGYSRVIRLNLFVNDELVDVYAADGVITATPTGSTAYNLSAGGPIANPAMELMIVTPVSAHSLSSRSVIFSKDDHIELRIQKSEEENGMEAVATFDGQSAFGMKEEDVLSISKAKEKMNLIKIDNTNFYETLRSKIGR